MSKYVLKDSRAKFIVKMLLDASNMTQLTSNRSDGPWCYINSIIVWTAIGILISVPFRSFKNLAYLCSFNFVINLVILFMSMGFIANSPPNYASAQAAYGYSIDPPAPISAVAIIHGAPLAGQVNGAMNIVFAWSGLMLFVEFMSEMRRPQHFVRSFMCSEGIIFGIYIMYGGKSACFRLSRDCSHDEKRMSTGCRGNGLFQSHSKESRSIPGRVSGTAWLSGRT